MRRVRSAFLSIALLVALAPSWAEAQSGRTAFNAVYVELGGNGLWYSLNYERLLSESFSVRAGFGYISVGTSVGTGTGGTASASVSSLSIPLTASFLGIGSASHKLEIGAGLLLERFSGTASSGFGENAEAGVLYPMGTATFGYRYIPAGGGFNFKLAVTPVYHPDLGTFPWGGMAFGFGF